MKKLLILLLLTSLLTKADDLYSINSNLSLTCDPTFSEVGEYDLDSFGFIVASTGICQFGEYQIEFFKNLRAAGVRLCDDQPYCGVKASWKGASWNIDTIVKDSSGNIVAQNLIDNVNVVLLNTPSFNLPYLVLQTKTPGARGSNEYFHLYSDTPSFHKVVSVGPDWYSSKGLYTNDQNEIFVDIAVITLPPDHPSMANIVAYPIAMRLVDNYFEPAVEQMKSDLKVYTQAEMQKINNQAMQIHSLIIKYVFNPEGDTTFWDGQMYNDIYQLGFMGTFVDLVRQGRIDLAWEFFDLAIPSTYDIRQKYNIPMYKTKKIMRATINNWLTSLEYWDEIKQLNEEFFLSEND